MLERRGYSVRIVANGRQALAALDEESFDLLLVDVRMPEVDGLQVVEFLRRGEGESRARPPAGNRPDGDGPKEGPRTVHASGDG